MSWSFSQRVMLHVWHTSSGLQSCPQGMKASNRLILEEKGEGREEEEKKRKGAETLFKKIIVENFPA